MQHWWEYDPKRYQREIEDLESAGIDYEKDEQALSEGKLVLRVRFPVAGELHDITIKYPTTYPYFRPKVIAPNIRLPYHQNPDDKNLCLLDQPTDSWNPEETAYDLLAQQFPKVLSAGTCTEGAEESKVSDIEVHQAEPRSSYYRYKPGSVLLVDGDWKPGETGSRGVFVIGFQPDTADLETCLAQGIRGAILELQSEAGTTFAKASVRIQDLYNSKKTYKGHWIQLPAAPDVLTSSDLIDFVKANWPKEAKFIESRTSSNGNGVIGFSFPEEKQWRGECGTGWLFLTFHGNKRKKHRIKTTFYLTKAERSGPSDLVERVPELHRLTEKTIAVVGCGCVGAPSVFEFAKSGIGEIRLWDGDSVSPGNSCRWPLGIPFTQWPKAYALAKFLKIHYPQTRFGHCVHHKLGDPDKEDVSEIGKFLENADLIFDATAERGVQLYLSSMASVMGIPYVMAESRPGGWGGVVARIWPTEGSGCYYCLLRALQECTIPSPPIKDEDFIQPQGCISPTFTAAGFDTSTISLAAVRLAISTLLGNKPGNYPSIEHDVGVLSLRDTSTGLATFPKWTSHVLPKHPDCDCSK